MINEEEGYFIHDIDKGKLFWADQTLKDCAQGNLKYDELECEICGERFIPEIADGELIGIKKKR